ncbi:MAG TPA: nicotinate-nucleotide--dimethylbenzimidazole phosphoribosyltransferase [Xanthobacteraceae bacterium]
MPAWSSLAQLRAACLELPEGHPAIAKAVRKRDAQLTKPAGSLGRLEDLVAWLAHWQAKNPPELEQVEILVFAGNHGVTAHGVSAFPSEVTAQMVANFASGGAAINQLAELARATLRVFPLALERPTADFTQTPALGEDEFMEAVCTGYEAVRPHADLVCVGEMGIGNTTTAAALSAALFGGGATRWAGRGTGIDEGGFARKRSAIERALARHSAILNDPLATAAALGGRELAAILGAVLAARHCGVPVLLDGFASTAAAAPLKKLNSGALAHAMAAHVSAESGHRHLLEELGLSPLLDLGMRLGEASGAALALLVLRAAVECHRGMATFDGAAVSRRSGGAD